MTNSVLPISPQGLKHTDRDLLFCAHGFYEEIICSNFRCITLYFLLWTILGFFCMWQLYRKWKLIIPAVAPWEEVWQAADPQLLHANIKQGQSCSGALWGREPLPGHSSWDLFASQSPLKNTFLFLLQVAKSHSTHRHHHLAKSLCLPWWQSVIYFSCEKVHIWPHKKLPSSARWAMCSHSPEHVMCFWSRSVTGHDSTLTPDPTHIFIIHTRLQICPSSFRCYVHFSQERDIFLVMWWQRHCKVT